MRNVQEKDLRRILQKVRENTKVECFRINTTISETDLSLTTTAKKVRRFRRRGNQDSSCRLCGMVIVFRMSCRK